MSITSMKYPLGYRSKSYTSDNSMFSIYIFKLNSINSNFTFTFTLTTYLAQMQSCLRNLSAVEFIHTACMSEVILPAESTVFMCYPNSLVNCFKLMGSKLVY